MTRVRTSFLYESSLFLENTAVFEHGISFEKRHPTRKLLETGFPQVWGINAETYVFLTFLIQNWEYERGIGKFKVKLQKLEKVCMVGN